MNPVTREAFTGSDALIAQTEPGLNALFDCAPIGFALLDRELCVLRANQAFVSLLSGHHGELVGTNLDASLPALAENLRPLLSLVLAGERVLDREVSILRTDDPRDVAYYSASYFPVRSPGATPCIGMTLLDITQRKEEEHFRDTFVGVLGHDLRTPLQSMVLSCEVALRQPDLPERARQKLLTLCDCSKRMGRMIEQILDLTRIRSGNGMPISLRRTDLVTIAREVVEQQQLLSPETPILLDAPASLPGQFDADRMAQVVGNLLGNAIRHGAVNQPIRLSLAERGERAELFVQNSGPPILESALEGLFQPFRKRLARREKSVGLGLGLFIAREIVVAHGGTISVQSTDQLTTFTVVLPTQATLP